MNDEIPDSLICTPEKAFQDFQTGSALIVDVRSAEDKLASGLPAGSLSLDWPAFHSQLKGLIQKHQRILLLCAVGHESLVFCQQLNQEVPQVQSIAGGFDAWFMADLPTEDFSLSDDDLRFDRQKQLRYVGDLGQEKLKNSHVLLVGLGGLGVPALQYLAAAGVGRLTLVDDDVVSLSNLPRQVIFQPDQVGLAKVKAAAAWVASHNSSLLVNPEIQKFSSTNADDLLNGVDVVLDCSDNIQCRQTINSYCLKNQVPWVFAAVTDFEIQLSFFDATDTDAPCFECLFPNTSAEQDRACNTQGVLGMTPGVAGTLQAAEAVKYLLGMDDVLKGRLLIDNLLTHQSKVLKYRARSQCSHHLTGKES